MRAGTSSGCYTANRILVPDWESVPAGRWTDICKLHEGVCFMLWSSSD